MSKFLFFNSTDLLPGTEYLVRVYSVSEQHESAPLYGIQKTGTWMHVWLVPSFKNSLMGLRCFFFFPVVMPSSLVELSLVSLETPRSWFPHRPGLLRYNREFLHRALDRSSCHHHGLQNPLPARAGGGPAQGGTCAPLQELHHPH